LIRIGLAVEATLITLLILLVIFTGGSPGMALLVLVLFMWALAVMVVAVQSASLIAGERSHQTLDVLCTTPLSGREIVLQKITGVRRLMILLWIPMLTIILPDAKSPAAIVCSLLSLAVYLPLSAWLSMLIGLKIKTRVRAIVAALALLCGWCLLPLVFIFMPLMMLRQAGDVTSPLNFSIFLSPAMILAVNEFGEWQEFGGDPWLAMTLNFLLYGTVLFLIRRTCLVHADRLLGRSESCRSDPPASPKEMPHAAAVESA
jgi:ABC-type Na+ efflux pump permease subunit